MAKLSSVPVKEFGVKYFAKVHASILYICIYICIYIRVGGLVFFWLVHAAALLS